MSSTQQEKTEAQAGPQAATFEELIGKPKRRLNFDVTLGTTENPVKRSMIFEAISSVAYDDLVAANPPTAAQLQAANGAGVAFNIDSFAPALISAVSHTPKLTYAQAEQLYLSKDWSGGEVSTLFFNAQRVCNQGLDVPFNGRG